MTSSKKRITLVGERGQVSQLLQARLACQPGLDVEVLSTEKALNAESLFAQNAPDLVVLCVLEFSSPQLIDKIPPGIRVLDVSPAFRTAPSWVYGLPELPGQRQAIESAHRVANPGCFATAVLLATAPLVRAGVLASTAAIYVDGVGGYTTGGSSMVEKAEAGLLPPETAFSLTREHRHIEEIRKYAQLTGPLWFTPKIIRAPRGIRVQIPLFGIDATAALSALQAAYAGSDIVADTAQPSKLAADEWAGRPGACLRVFPQSDGCMVTCSLDNLGKGAVDAAYDNIHLMLTGDDVQSS